MRTASELSTLTSGGQLSAFSFLISLFKTSFSSYRYFAYNIQIGKSIGEKKVQQETGVADLATPHELMRSTSIGRERVASVQAIKMHSILGSENWFPEPKIKISVHI